MPRANIYLREEDMGLWKALDNKSQWVHEQLTGVEAEVDSQMIKVLVQQQVEAELNRRQQEYV